MIACHPDNFRGHQVEELQYCGLMSLNLLARTYHRGLHWTPRGSIALFNLHTKVVPKHNMLIEFISFQDISTQGVPKLAEHVPRVVADMKQHLLTSQSQPKHFVEKLFLL
jgi:hypothetical protein